MGEAAGQVTGWDERDDTARSADADPVADDPEIVGLVEEIEETRGELSTTVEQIGDKLDPRNIVADAKETVREATIGKVEQMANTAGDMVTTAGETAQQAGSGMLETVRRNPIPAALAGIGIGWLAMNMRNQNTSWNADQWKRSGDQWRYAGSDWRSNASWEQSRGTSGGSGGGIGEQVGDKVGQVGDTASQALSSAQHTAQDVADRVGQTAGEVPRRVEDMAGQVGSQASRLFQDNPLAVGAIAVAVGTAVGLALPVTQTERRVLGEARDQVIDKAETAASQVLGEAEQQARSQQ